MTGESFKDFLTNLKLPDGFELPCPIPEFLREKRCASIIKNKPHGGNKNPITFYRGFMHTYIIVCHHTFRLIKATLMRVVWVPRSVLGPFDDESSTI